MAIARIKNSTSVKMTMFSSKTRVELQPIQVDTILNALIKLTPPILTIPDVRFFELIKPNGDVFSLDDKIKTNTSIVMHLEEKAPKKFTIKTRRVKKSKTYEVLNLEKNTTFDGLVIGPLMEQNHGNWVLSAYLKDLDDNWVEMFQVITISITEYIPNRQSEVKRRIKENFHLAFAYPVKGLESCELISPKGANISSIHRDEDTKSRCAYVVKDLTVNDAGLWEIVGVANIIYRGQTRLQIRNKKT